MVKVKTESIKEEVKPTDCELVKAEINKYDWDTNLAFSIAKAESSCNINAIGDDYPINGLHAPSCGAFQIRTLEGRPNCDQLKDIATNVAWAYKISNNGTNFKPWSVYISGKYLRYKE